MDLYNFDFNKIFVMILVMIEFTKTFISIPRFKLVKLVSLNLLIKKCSRGQSLKNLNILDYSLIYIIETNNTTLGLIEEKKLQTRWNFSRLVMWLQIFFNI